MIQVAKQDMNKIAHLFAGWDETLILSCLQGCMGDAYTDNIDNPQAARIIIADFCFFAGESSSSDARELVGRIHLLGDCKHLIFVPQNEGWSKLIESVYPDKCDKSIRYAFKKESGIFNLPVLEKLTKSIPYEYTLHPIDETIYHLSKKHAWSYDFCSQFTCYDHYKNNGIGFAVMYNNDTLVCGASSYTIYNEGIEIEIDTHQDHRQKGLATACAAKLIIECTNRGLYPSWDAANKTSVALAQKLGYNFDHEYHVYFVVMS